MTDLNRTAFIEELRLVPGMVLAVYMDTGPKGPCGQSMSVTCPHVTIGVYKTWPEAYEGGKAMNRFGRNWNLQYVEIGGGGSAQFNLVSTV